MQITVSARSAPAAKRLRVALLVWLAMVGLDLLLNGALFARIYRDGGPFLLAPEEAFRRIPLGYAAFLILAIGIVEVTYRLRIAGWAGGLRLGLGLGGGVAAIWTLSLYSITTIRADVAVAFAVVWLALLLAGCVVAAIGLARASLRRLSIEVLVFDLACLVTVVALQSFGVVPVQTS